MDVWPRLHRTRRYLCRLSAARESRALTCTPKASSAARVCALLHGVDVRVIAGNVTRSVHVAMCKFCGLIFTALVLLPLRSLQCVVATKTDGDPVAYHNGTATQ